MLESQVVCPICGLGSVPASADPSVTVAAEAGGAAPAGWMPPPVADLPPTSAPVGAPVTGEHPPVPAPYEFAAAASAPSWAPSSAPSSHWGQPAALPVAQPDSGPMGYPPPPGGPGAYPLGSFNDRSSRPSRPWIIVAAVAAVVLVLAGGLTWWTQRAKPSATGVVQADGATVVDTRGIAITTPVGWTVLSTTPDAIVAAAKAVSQSNPNLASAVNALASREHRNELRFFAYGVKTAAGYTPNANVLVTKTSVPLGNVVSASSSLLTSIGATNIHQQSATTGAESGIELTYQLPINLPTGGSITVSIEQLYVSKGSEVGILSVGSLHPNDSSLQTLIDTFRLT
jgi:hypothetical protein